MSGTARVQAILELRDTMTAGLQRATSGVKSFASESHGAVGKLNDFAGSVGKTARSIVEGFGSKVSQIVTDFFSKLKLGVGIGIAAMALLVEKSATSAMSVSSNLRMATGLIRAAGASPAQADVAYGQLLSGVEREAPILGVSPDKLSQSLYMITSNFTNVNDALAVMDAGSKAAAASGADLNTVDTALVRVMGAYGASAQQAGQYTNWMQAAVNYGLMTFQDFGQTITQVTGAAAALKIPFDQVAGAIAQLTRRGMLPDEAGTGLNRFLLNMLKPSPEVQQAAANMFGANWQQYFSATAVSAHGLSGVLADVMGKIKPTAAQLKDLNAAASTGNDADLQNAEAAILGSRVNDLVSLVGDVRGLRAALLLTATDGSTFVNALKNENNSVGASTIQWQEHVKSLSYAKESFSALMNVIMEKMLDGALGGLSTQLASFGSDLTAVVDSPAFDSATLGGKLSMLGGVMSKEIGKWWTAAEPEVLKFGNSLWHDITRWWDDNQSTVLQDVTDFFQWFGQKAIPLSVTLGTKLGEALIGALTTGIVSASSTLPGAMSVALGVGLWKGMDNIGKSPLGSGAAGAGELGGAATALDGSATALMEAAAALKLAAGGEGAAAGGVAAEGGVLAAGGSTGMLKTLFPGGLIANVASVALAGAIVYFSAKEVYQTWKDQGGKVRGAEAGATGFLAHQPASGQGDATVGASFGKAESGGTVTRATSRVAQVLFGGSTPTEVATKAMAERAPDILSRDEAMGSDVSGIVNPVLAKLQATGGLHLEGIKTFQQLLDSSRNKSITGWEHDQIIQALAQVGFNANQQLQQAEQTAQAELSQRDAILARIGAEQANNPIQAAADQQALSNAQSVNEIYNATGSALDNILKKLGILNTYSQPPPPPASPLTPGEQSASNRDNLNKGTANFGPVINRAAGIGPAPGGPPRPPLVGVSGIANILAPGAADGGVPIGHGGLRKMAAGGSGRVSRPTLFLAGEAGSEDFAFSGAGRRFGSGGVAVAGPLIGVAHINSKLDIEDVADQLATALEHRVQNSSPPPRGNG